MKTVPAKTILAKTKSRAWFGADYNMNLYRGCCHGCIYCDSRSECYGLDDFGTVRAKENAIEILGRELPAKRRKGVISMGAMSDPYNPFEREERLTRRALELIGQNWFGVGVATKGDLVARDADLLFEISKNAPVIVKITVTAADDALGRKVEPHAPLSSARLKVVERLAASGVFAGVLMMPVLPFLEDNAENVRGIVRRAADAGAKFVYAGMGVTLRDRQRDYYYQKLDELFPGASGRYRRRYGGDYSCGALGARELYRVFAEECRKFGLLYNMKEIVEAYQGKYRKEQLSFL